MSSRGGGAARPATRLREQTASAGAAGAEPTSGTPQRNRPCQCHRPSRGKASILPSKCALFLPAPLRSPSSPGAPRSHRPPRRGREALCARQPRGASAAAPARSHPPSPGPDPGLPRPRGDEAWGSLGRAPRVVEGAAGSGEAQFPPGRASPARSSHRGWWGCWARERERESERASRFPSCQVFHREGPSAPSPICPTLRPISERSGLLSAGAQLPRFHNATSKSS